MDLDQWVEKIRQGDPRALARALSEVENRGPRSRDLLRALFPFSGKARRLGVTGAPGAGKSTLVSHLCTHLRLGGHKVAIIAIDPTSPFSGGSILGDRVRMQAHYSDHNVFIRSMAARGSLGGLAPATADVMLVLEAAGFSHILIETVGVGQAEVEVARLASVVTVVLTPAAGDDVQALKAGIMEIADVFVINKADLPGADRLESEVEGMLSLAPQGNPPPIVRTVGTAGKGIEEWARAIESRVPQQAMGALYWEQRLLMMVRDRLMERLTDSTLTLDKIKGVAAAIAERRDNPYEAVEEILGTANARVDHIGVAVRSLEAALGFYEQALGLEKMAIVEVAGEKVRVAMLPAGEPRIELLEATSPDSTIAKFIERRGEGLHHVAMRVPDLAKAVARLKSSGAKLVTEQIQEGAEGYRYVFIHPKSAGGVLLELIED
jgi:GTPase